MVSFNTLCKPIEIGSISWRQKAFYSLSCSGIIKFCSGISVERFLQGPEIMGHMNVMTVQSYQVKTYAILKILQKQRVWSCKEWCIIFKRSHNEMMGNDVRFNIYCGQVILFQVGLMISIRPSRAFINIVHQDQLGQISSYIILLYLGQPNFLDINVLSFL